MRTYVVETVYVVNCVDDKGRKSITGRHTTATFVRDTYTTLDAAQRRCDALNASQVTKTVTSGDKNCHSHETTRIKPIEYETMFDGSDSDGKRRR